MGTRGTKGLVVGFKRESSATVRRNLPSASPEEGLCGVTEESVDIACNVEPTKSFGYGKLPAVSPS